MYLDGFVVPVPKDRIDDYRAMAERANALWIEHGALSAVEAMGDDVPDGTLTSFPMAVTLQPGEVVFFSFITFRDKADRDRVNAAVMADPRLEMPGDPTIFDAKRMIWGGFQPVVQLGGSE